MVWWRRRRHRRARRPRDGEEDNEPPARPRPRDFHPGDAAPDIVEKIRLGNTAREAQEIVLAYGVQGFFDRVAEKVSTNCRRYVEDAFSVETVITDADGTILGRAVA